MAELLQENWILVVAALLIGIAVAWWIFVASRRTKVEADTLAEESGAAKRNQALIDAPPAAAKDDLPPPTPDGLAGTGTPVAAAAATHTGEQENLDETAASPGELSAAANSASVAASPLGTDAETGDGVPMREAMKDVPPTDHKPAPAPASPSANGDDLRRIKGVGPKLVTILHDMNVTTYAQIAEWDDADIDRIDAKLGRFQGRIRRDSWVEQAKLLAGDDVAAYEAKFGRTS